MRPVVRDLAASLDQAPNPLFLRQNTQIFAVCGAKMAYSMNIDEAAKCSVTDQSVQ